MQIYRLNYSKVVHCVNRILLKYLYKTIGFILTNVRELLSFIVFSLFSSLEFSSSTTTTSSSTYNYGKTNQEPNETSGGSLDDQGFN